MYETQAFRSDDGKLYDTRREATLADRVHWTEQKIVRFMANQYAQVEGEQYDRLRELLHKWDRFEEPEPT